MGSRAQPFDLVHGREPFDIAQDHEAVEWLAEQGLGRKVKRKVGILNAGFRRNKNRHHLVWVIPNPM